MRTYEIIFILKPDLPEGEADRFVTQMEGVVTSTGGTLRKVDRMGRRHLAYRIQKYKEGEYVLLVTDSGAPTVQEVERRLKVSDPVLKYQTVRVDEDMKRLAKRQQERAQRSSRKHPKTAAEPPAPRRESEAG
ncbi:MAG: 30S ribosomal protein S6 [Acidobacteria bacterium RIFCSPLOWO2_02_FULL_61_28]|nr:MAG: 30S ribosomal protein S6 [Acidobacteria bacterium RIFCSPLOWO2_02_FULL_61_28]